ncbi:tetratricopeptide repeat protein [Desulfurivibrio sp. D14AmB]|uniref:tetratricopeptide repeat protein n=1 Tax=Desulfurivibrio sp. D14AmB TaxID=3374370 RepID=UPI00376EF392
MQPIPTNPEAEEQEPEKTPAELDYDEGLELLKRGSFPQAAAAFHNALRGFEEEKNEAGIARAVTKLAELCLEKEEYAKALPQLERALAICRAAEDDLSATYLQKRLLKAHMGLRDYPAARELALELLNAYQDYNNPAGAVEMMERMAEIYLATGEKEKAAESYRTMAAIHKNFKHTRAAQAMLDQAEAVLRS